MSEMCLSKVIIVSTTFEQVISQAFQVCQFNILRAVISKKMCSEQNFKCQHTAKFTWVVVNKQLTPRGVTSNIQQTADSDVNKQLTVPLQLPTCFLIRSKVVTRVLDGEAE